MRIRSCIPAAVALSVTLALGSGLAAAQAPGAAPTAATASTATVDVRTACKADIEALCPGVERGEARRTCLEANKEKVSDSCKTARTAARDANQDRRDAFRAACADDIAKLCSGVERGQGKVAECVRANADKVTPACKTQISALPAGDKAGEPTVQK